MKRSYKSIFENLFGKSKLKSTPIILTGYSQPHVLQQRMKEQNLTHGERVKVHIGPVRILDWHYNEFAMHFCPMQCIEIKKRIEPGDGGALPAEAILENIKFPKKLKPGLFIIKDVELFSNGTLQVIANANTKFEMI